MKILASDSSYKTFSNLVTGYRSLAVIMQAIQAGLIESVGKEPCAVQHLLGISALCHDEGRRFIDLLISLGIFEQYDGLLYLSGFSRRYLFSVSTTNQLDVLEFEKLLIEKWNGLGSVLRNGQSTPVCTEPQDSYEEKRRLFQGAMHEAALVRSHELWEALQGIPESGLIIDIGAGDGTYLREFLGRHPGWSAIACDLNDVLELNRSVNDDAGITNRPCNIIDLDERNAFVVQCAGSCNLLLLSNLIHCYSPSEVEVIIASLGKLLTDEGLLVVHDFFRDGNSFGALYDIHMMVNTYNGRCYSFDETARMLKQAGFSHSEIIELPSYSHAVIASRQVLRNNTSDPLSRLHRQALSLGFFEAVAVTPTDIRTEPWVKAKCRYGCMFYGRKWSCPPHSMENREFSDLLECYSKALLVAGQAPLKDFQARLLELEKVAFLNGHIKALVFTGGPCCWCDECPDDRCLFPEKRRPSLESCGCDVFALAELCGIPVSPIRNNDDFVQYVGLLLVE